MEATVAEARKAPGEGKKAAARRFQSDASGDSVAPHVPSYQETTMSKLMATAAESWMSTHGHVSHDEVDCSHFVTAVIKASDSPGFRYITADEFMSSPHFYRVDAPEAGDLVHWPGHIAVVIDPAMGTFIGSQSSTGVAKTSYKTNPYWSGRSHRTFLRYSGH